MSICTAQLRNTYNAPTLRMSGEQICLQVLPKLQCCISPSQTIRYRHLLGQAESKPKTSPVLNK